MASKRFCLVTGASSGIGRAVAVHLSKQELGVIAVARRQEQLEETRALGNASNIEVVSADVTTEEGRQSVADAVAKLCPDGLHYVVQNAGSLGKIGKALSVDPETWRRTFAINVDAPLFLTQKLASKLAPQARILHIGSGAAHRPTDGWITYCSSKAAFHMMYQCLGLELKAQDVLVGSVRPGIIDSAMQDTIREAETEEMAEVQHFRNLKDNQYSGEDADKPHKPPTDGLDTAENVAWFVDFLLTETSNEEFGASEWDIREPSHHDRWIK